MNVMSDALRARPKDRAQMRVDSMERLDRRVHDLYLLTEAMDGHCDDEEFVHLHGLRVECDPECNRLVSVINRLDLWDPQGADPNDPQGARGMVATCPG